MKYPITVVLSLTTGVLLTDKGFGAMHEFAEYLAGEPIFTHQFAHKPFNRMLREAVFAQHPQLRDVDASGVNEESWVDFAVQMVERFGQYLDVQPRTAADAKLSQEAFIEPLRGKKVIGVAIP